MAAPLSFKQLKLSVQGIPIRCQAEDELRAIVRHTIGTRVADQKDQRATENATQNRHIRFQIATRTLLILSLSS
jgi:hypothetical protein